jgi:hypothetical protein
VTVPVKASVVTVGGVGAVGGAILSSPQAVMTPMAASTTIAREINLSVIKPR